MPPTTSTDAEPDLSATAIARHTARMRRLGLIYAAVLVAVLAAGAAVVRQVWVHGEVHNTHLHTATHPADDVQMADPSAALSVAWTTADRGADGVPHWRGTVVTLGKHAVRGRDATTGAVTWSYTRADRVACSATQQDGVTFAFFRVNGNCDELTALDTRTGARRWTRTLDMDGHPVNGTPIVTSTLDSVMVTTSRVIYVIDPSSGLDRWEYHPDSCTISAAVLGPAGALIAQTCVHPDCSQVRQGLCGDGPQLLLRDAQQGRDGDNRKTGRNTDGKDIDQIIWNDIGNDDLPVAAGPVVAALNRTTRALDIFDQARGRPTATAILAPVPATLDGAVATVTTVNALVRLGAAVHALDARGTQIWTVAASGPATVTPVSDVQWPAEPASSRVTVVAGSTVLSVDARTGAVRNRSTLPHAVPTGTLAYPLGTGYLAIGRAGVVAYR